MDRKLKKGAASAAALISVAVGGAGCLSRPVVSNPPELQTNVAYTKANSQIDQVDLLFDIDNSSSMGDKQAFLSQAVPKLVGRLIQPNCLASAGGKPYPSTFGPTGPTCSAGDSIEFPPVHDLHIAILSSSLGGRGGDICDPTSGSYGPRADDQAHLLGNGTSGFDAGFSNMASPSNFLAWAPSWGGSTPNVHPIETDPKALIKDFGDMVVDVGAHGCGIESQLESWYRFLIQPDPYASINVDKTSNVASWSDAVDTTILQERADFLRPTSLVAIIVLTDENDSEVDVRSFGGLGYSYMQSAGNGILCQLPAVCNTNPNDPSCVFSQNGSNCANGAYTAQDSWGFNANLRHVHMKEKYGLDPQYPISRYVTGLSSPTIPDRSSEYPQGATGYDGTNLNCTNPLFAGTLYKPSSGTINYSTEGKHLCNPPQDAGAGGRTADMIFYAIIGGVPYQDLHYPDAGANGTVDWSTYALTAADWTWILGKDPEAHDYNGIDPHMIEDYKPRQQPSFSQVTVPGTTPPAADIGGPGGNASATIAPTSTLRTSAQWDPINGREWITDGVDDAGNPVHAVNGLPVDREYACIFPLTTPRDCTNPAFTSVGCDCQATGLSHDQTPPVCGEPPNDPVTLQKFAKAYPTTRELLVARDLGRTAGANPGIVSSICPVIVDPTQSDEPYYGYNPAMGAIVEKLKEHLTTTCIPALVPDPVTNKVSCLLLAQLAPGKGTAGCKGVTGLSDPDPAILARFINVTYGNNPPKGLVICQVDQSPEPVGKTCATDQNAPPGWCYVQIGADAGGVCSQQIDLTANLSQDALQGAKVSYQCLQTSIRPDGG